MRIPRACVLLACLLAAPFLPPTAASSGAEPFSVCSGDVCLPEERGTGLLAAPAGAPRGIVAIMHGYGHLAQSHAGHLAHLAEQGYVAFAMDYGASPAPGGMHLGRGAADTCAAVEMLRAQYPGVPSYLYSVSMGGAPAGIVLAECGPWEYWVSNEGMTTIVETWAEARALAPANAYAASAVRDIEAECGGTPATAPACYAERTTVARVPEFRGLKGVVQTHGLNDGLVPYDQGRELKAALEAAGIPSDFHTVVRSAPGTEGTTITGYSPLGGMGLAGHGTESNDAHALTALSFELLDAVLAGELVPSGRETVHDAGLGRLP